MRTMIIRNACFKIGQTLTIVGVCGPHSAHFAVNIGPSEETVALHVNPRFKYSAEQRDSSFSLCTDGHFKIIIKFERTEFLVTLSDGPNICFPNSIGAEQYSIISVDGDACITKFDIKKTSHLTYQPHIMPQWKKWLVKMCRGCH